MPRDNIDKVLVIGASFDWISPLISLFRTRGWGHYAYHEDYAPYVYTAVCDMRENGVEVRGYNIYQETIVFSVRKRDTAMAYACLRAVGLAE